jgi:hypothetical protein
MFLYSSEVLKLGRPAIDNNKLIEEAKLKDKGRKYHRQMKQAETPRARNVELSVKPRRIIYFIYAVSHAGRIPDKFHSSCDFCSKACIDIIALYTSLKLLD